MWQNNIDKSVESIRKRINVMLCNKSHIIVAIDGRCASGKTTLADKLYEKMECNLIHMDDFFLRPEQRTEKRLATPGENVDYERFFAEVLQPLIANQVFSYRPYDCKLQDLKEPIKISPKKVTIIEGSYSCHNSLWKYYDLRIFMDVDTDTQLSRIKIRNGEEAVNRFKNLWIPLEEKYFETFDIKERCEILILLSEE